MAPRASRARVRLLLDEHYSSSIAATLRERGHDVVAVQERPELAGVGDTDLLRLAATERRALVTENVRDFAPLVREWALASERHYGVVFTSPRSLPRSRRMIGRHIDALERLLEERTPEDALADSVHWLTG